MSAIAASILNANYSNLREEIETVDNAGADMFTLDVMDGRFVPTITFGDYVVARVREWTALPIETHLMVEDPLNWIDLMADAGADVITFHVEATEAPEAVIERIRARDRSVGIAIDLTTSVEAAIPLLPLVDLVNLLAVPAGFGGQTFHPETHSRIARVREAARQEGTEIAIEVDGGIKVENAREVATAGGDILVVGTGIYRSLDRQSAVRRFKEEVGVADAVTARLLGRSDLSRSRSPEVVKRLIERRDALGIPPTSWPID